MARRRGGGSLPSLLPSPLLSRGRLRRHCRRCASHAAKPAGWVEVAGWQASESEGLQLWGRHGALCQLVTPTSAASPSQAAEHAPIPGAESTAASAVGGAAAGLSAVAVAAPAGCSFCCCCTGRCASPPPTGAVCCSAVAIQVRFLEPSSPLRPAALLTPAAVQQYPGQVRITCWMSREVDGQHSQSTCRWPPVHAPEALLPSASIGAILGSLLDRSQKLTPTQAPVRLQTSVSRPWAGVGPCLGATPRPQTPYVSQAGSRSCSPSRRRPRCRPRAVAAAAATGARCLLRTTRRLCWDCDSGAMDVTKLDCFRYCRFLRHAGKVRGLFGTGAQQRRLLAASPLHHLSCTALHPGRRSW